jgi:hypothetical protein
MRFAYCALRFYSSCSHIFFSRSHIDVRVFWPTILETEVVLNVEEAR